MGEVHYFIFLNYLTYVSSHLICFLSNLNIFSVFSFDWYSNDHISYF